jgi:hypothetical protein
MSKINRPKQLNPVKWEAIMALDGILEAISNQISMLEAHAENPGACPAVENYAEEFDVVIDVVQNTFDVLSEQAKPLVDEIVTALENFRQAKLTAVANCTKPTCPDKESAQLDLGWVGGDQILQ